MDTELTEFIVAAKRATYAAVDEGGEQQSSDGAKKLEYSRGGLHYQDVYYGSTDFAGQETVFKQRKPIWAMNYYGATPDRTETKELYAFLKTALKEVTIDAPYRGRARLTNGALEYSNEWHGSPERFHGREQISKKGIIVYELRYEGGLIGRA